MQVVFNECATVLPRVLTNMADVQDNRPGEEEEEEEEIDDSVSSEALQLWALGLTRSAGLQDNEGCRPLRN